MGAMGTKNKERRRARQAKGRKDGQTHGLGRVPGPGDRRPGHGQASGIDSEAVEWAVFRAAHAGCDRATAGDRQPMLDLLGAGFGLPGGREVVARRLTVMLTVDLTSALDGGWGPDALVQVVARRAGKAASAFAAGALTDAVRRSRAGRRGGAPAPAAQAGSEHLARSLDPSAGDWPAQLLAAVDAFAAVEHLPPLPDLGSLGAPSRTARSQEEERQLARVRALLAKAEASDFAAESETFMAKAQELMTRYCLDRTAVQGGSGSDPGAGPEVEGRRVWLEDPYLQAKGLLLGAVAAANRCRTVISSEIGFATVIGFGVDLDATELLFTSLLAQATQRLAALGPNPGQDGRHRPGNR